MSCFDLRFFTILFFLGLAQSHVALAQNDYPKIDSSYSREKLVSLFDEFESKQDTVGLLYTIGAYHTIQPGYDSINIKYFPFLIRNIERMEKESLIDFYKLKIVILSFYIKSDINHLKQASIVCQQIQQVALEKGWDKLVLDTSHLQYRIYQLTGDGEREHEFFDLIRRYRKYENQIDDIGILYNFHAAIWYWSNRDYEQSLKYFIKTESIGEAINKMNLNMTSKLFICQINRLLKNYDESLKYGLQALAISEETNVVDLQRWNHEELAILYESGFKNYKLANNHWKQYFRLIKRIETIDNASIKVPDLQLQLIEERLSSENEKLSLKNNFISKDLESKNVILKLSVSIATLIAVIAAMMYVWAKQYRIATENNKYLLINEARELERQKISQDLHDSVGGNIFAIKGHISSKAPNYEKIIGYLDNMYDHIRQTSHILSATGISEVGLIESCQDFIKLFEEKVSIDLKIHGEPTEMSENFSVQLYRIIQEVILNSIKHSKADQIFLSFYFDKLKFMVNIEDNGKGFDTTQHYSGLGLPHIRHNVRLLHGKMELTSSEKGTIYWFEFKTKRI